MLAAVRVQRARCAALGPAASGREQPPRPGVRRSSARLRAVPTFPLSFLAQVGKTSLIMALVGEEFPEEVSAELQGSAGTAVSSCSPGRLEAERCFLRAASPFARCSFGASFPAAPSGGFAASLQHRSRARGRGRAAPAFLRGCSRAWHSEQGCHCSLQSAHTCPSGPPAVWLAVLSQLACRRGIALPGSVCPAPPVVSAHRQIALTAKHKLAGGQLVSSTFLCFTAKPRQSA